MLEFPGMYLSLHGSQSGMLSPSTMEQSLIRDWHVIHNHNGAITDPSLARYTQAQLMDNHTKNFKFMYALTPVDSDDKAMPLTDTEMEYMSNPCCNLACNIHEFVIAMELSYILPCSDRDYLMMTAFWISKAWSFCNKMMWIRFIEASKSEIIIELIWSKISNK